MKIIVYAHTAPEIMYQRGIDAGLSEDAADFFRHFDEVKLELEVEEATGKVLSVRAVE